MEATQLLSLKVDIDGPRDETQNEIASTNVPNVTNVDDIKTTVVNSTKIHELVWLYINETSIILEPISKESNGDIQCLVINRIEFSLQLSSKQSLGLNSADSWNKYAERQSTPRNRAESSEERTDHLLDSNTNDPILIYGCLGVIQLIAGHYLLVITEREQVCTIKNKPIYLITKTSLVQIPVDLSPLLEDEKRMEREYISMLMEFTDSSRFYYSYLYDVTQSAERQARFFGDEQHMPLWKRVDHRFFWNAFIQKDFIKNKLDQWILPIMDGCAYRGNPFSLCQLSRRGCARTGRRFQMRGVDAQGYVANFVETEQLVQHCDISSSFVQIRGSIPILWSQKNKSLKPKPTVEPSFLTRYALSNHFEEQLRLYRKQIVVNLVDQTGAEGELGSSFESSLKLYNHSDIQYVAFDFHAKCKGNKYDNLNLLLDQVKDNLTRFGYFLEDSNGKPILNQTGCFRTNCVDCLDRTNVVQSLFAHFMLKIQLSHLGIIQTSAKLEDFPSLETSFKNVWADNADILSQQYTGTGALKTDYTRTGKRSVKGMATDGLNSFRRVINSTFQDDERQASIDLFLGKYIVGKMNFLNTDGAHNFAVTKMDEDDPSGLKALCPAYLEINTTQFTIVEYLIQEAQQREFTFSALKQVEKSFQNYRLLKLLFATGNLTCHYVFTSVLARQRFLELVQEHCFKYTLPKSLSPLERTTLFIGTWNMQDVKTAPSLSTISSWIPHRDSDLIIVGVQNCNYTVPVEYSFTQTKFHWYYLLQSYLGPQWLCIGTVSTTKHVHTDLIILVREEKALKINNMMITKVRYRHPDRSKPAQAESLKEKLLMAKDKFTKEAKEKAQKLKDTVLDQSILGGAITFRIHETPFCFINCAEQKSQTSEVLLLLNKEADIGNHFHHTFWFGAINTGTVNGSKWVSLNQEATSGIYWRSLPSSDPLMDLSSPKTDGSNPMSASFALQVTRDPPLSPSSCRIVLSSLSLDLVNLNQKVDVYLIIFAPFIEHGFKTPMAKKKPPSWTEVIELRPFFNDQEYLKLRYIHVEVWYKDKIGEEYAVGYATISLKQAFNEKTSPFETLISMEDEPVGTCKGELLGYQI